MSLTVPTDPGGPLVSLYRGALIGQALSKNLGQAQSEGGDISQAIHATLLQTGVAAGRIDPAKLNPQDQQLLNRTVSEGISKIPTVKPQAGGGLLHDIGLPFQVIGNTATDFANALTGIPQGLMTLGKAAYKTAQETTPFAHSTIAGPDLGDVGKSIVKSTISDFTNFDPMHPLYPVLDIAGALSGGAGLLARTGGGLARLAEAGRLARAGEDVGKLAGTIGRAPTVQSLGNVGQRLAKGIAGLERPTVPISQAAQDAANLSSPAIPIANYSMSPFRRLMVEKPIERFATSRLGNASIPLLPGDRSFADLRGAYHIRKAVNANRGRASALSVSRTVQATQGLNHAMHDLLRESANDQIAGEKFNALVLLRQLAGENLTPEERLQRLEDYRNAVLSTGTPRVEGVPLDTTEADQVRQFYRKLTATTRFQEFFAHPTEGMWNVRNAWDEAIMKGLRSLSIDPHELLNRSLGPAAYVLRKTPEEMLREQPFHIQRSMQFALQAHDVETAIRDALKSGEEPPERALLPKLAETLPRQVDLNDRIALVTRAYHSLRAEAAGIPPRELLNNAESTGYLPGNNLAQKIAQALPAYGVPEAVAEPYASGGLTNYFPQVSALHTQKLRHNAGPIGRATNALIRKPLAKVTGGLVHEKDVGVGLHEFRRENIARLANSRFLGVEPFSSFLQEADLSSFRAGVDRRDPMPLIRHIGQREKLLAHRELAEPMIERLALKAPDGTVAQFSNEAELADKLGSVQEAQRWRLISPRAIQALVVTEDQTALDVANALREEGSMTPELMQHIDQIADEGALQYVRQLSDEVITKGDKQIAVPATYMDNLIKQARVMDSGNRVGHVWQAFINKWRTAVLAYMPSWLLRTSMGHGVLLFISGVWNPTHYFKAMQYFGNGFKVPFTEDSRVFQGLGREVPAGIDQGSPHQDFGAIGHKMAIKNPIPTGITHGVHNIANFQRRAAFISNLNRITKQHFAELRQTFSESGGLRNTRNLDAVIREHPEWVHHALNELDKVSYTFGQMAPWERRLAKNILPFWGWYKFVSKFVWNLPITYPGRALALARLGELGQEDQASLGQMPDWLRSSLMFGTHNLADVHYMSMMGLNPLGDVMNPAAGFQGIVRLGQMSPIMQSALEGMGYNTMTGGLERIDPASGIEEVNGVYIDLATGKEYDNPGQASVGAALDRFFGSLARSFPEIRIAELGMTGGKAVYPESIPLIYERPIPPSSPAALKNVTPLGLLAQYAGVAPKTYNLQKYRVNLLKDIRRGITQQHKAVLKEKAMK